MSTYLDILANALDHPEIVARAGPRHGMNGLQFLAELRHRLLGLANDDAKLDQLWLRLVDAQRTVFPSMPYSAAENITKHTMLLALCSPHLGGPPPRAKAARVRTRTRDRATLLRRRILSRVRADLLDPAEQQRARDIAERRRAKEMLAKEYAADWFRVPVEQRPWRKR